LKVVKREQKCVVERKKMKSVFAFMWSVSFLLTAQGEETAPKPIELIHFQENMTWKQVQELAKRERKYIFLDCFATWCGPCKAMDQKTYPEEKVAEFMNKAFISVKVQCDSSKNDGDAVKNWYTDAHQITTEFGINAFPSLLFFSPDGELVHKGLGFRDPDRFIALAKDAMDTSKQYYTLLRKYKEAKLDEASMSTLLGMARSLGDISTVAPVAKAYLHGYYDRLPDSVIFEKSTLDQINRYYVDYLSSKNRIFTYIIRQTQKVDSVIEKIGFAYDIAKQVIYRDEIAGTISTAKSRGVSPDWEAISRTISANFGKEYADRLIPKAKLDWYSFKKEWEEYCAVAIERIEKGGFVNNTEDKNNLVLLNNFAYEIFKRSNDKLKLEKALDWSKLVVAAAKDNVKYPQNLYIGDFMDTEANILYKLGRKKEALSTETLAANKKPEEPEIKDQLKAMQDGRPTW
jgi:thioredoxin-related protein